MGCSFLPVLIASFAHELAQFCFIGAFLFCILRNQVKDLDSVSEETLYEYLNFANAYVAYTTTKESALAAMAIIEEMIN